MKRTVKARQPYRLTSGVKPVANAPAGAKT